ncbi:MAG: (2Fe-2S)-binding protein [Candidatus Eremiobacterota bacterium]
MKTIKVKVNDKDYTKDVPEHRTLLEFLRQDLFLTGTKEGCGAGECGACTVILDGRTVNACLVLAAECDGSVIRTIEGEGTDGKLSPLQEAFHHHHAVQCGFCTPGMIMSARALLDRNPHPSEEDVKEAIEGNFCRCTGYKQIVEAIMEVSEGKGVK